MSKSGFERLFIRYHDFWYSSISYLSGFRRKEELRLTGKNDSVNDYLQCNNLNSECSLEILNSFKLVRILN